MKPRFLPLFLPLAIAATALADSYQLAASSKAQGQPSKLDELRLEFQIQRQKLEEPFKNLNEKYLAALERLSEQAREEGDLDEVLAIQK